MSEEMVEVVLSHAGQTRRSFMKKLVLGSAVFAVPAVASFAIGGTAAPRRSPIQTGAQEVPVDCGPNATDCGPNVIDVGPNTIDCGPNSTDCGPNVIDEGPNTPDDGSNTPDDGSNTPDDGSNSVDEGSNTPDDGSNTGSGVPGGGQIPSTE